MKKVIIYLFFIYFSISSKSHSEIVNDIQINGNKRIITETIIEYGKIIKNKDYNLEDLNDIQKKIFATGFFEKVNLSIKNNKLLIQVVENPLINFFTIQGERISDDVNKLYDLVKLGNNKIYSEYIFKNDLGIIKEYFLQRGYTEIEVIPRVSKLDNGQLNILININKGEETKINRIYFIGDKKFNSSELLDVITSSEYGWWKFLSSTNVLNENRIKIDKEVLKNYYLNNGYYDVQITSVNINKISKNKSDIVFSINAGSLYLFGDLKIIYQETNLPKDINQYINALKKKYIEKKKYSINSLRSFLNNLNDKISKSKIDFVSAEIDQIKNNKIINLELKIKSLQKIYVNKINVTGNSITDEDVIRRNLTFSEGDSYNDYKVKKSIDNLKNTKIFKDVSFKNNITNNNLNTIDIIVVEQPTGSISAGAGYGGDGATISFGLTESNFLGKGYVFNTNLSVGTQRIIGEVGATIPDFMNTNKSLYTNLYSTKTNLSNTVYESGKTGFDVGTRYEIFEDIFFKPGIGFNYEHITVDANSSAYFKSQAGYYSTEKINYNIESDGRDNKFGTRNGTLLGFTQELATIATDIPYIRNSIYGTSYYPITDKQTFNLKYGYSNITRTNSNQSIKLSDRLFIPYQYSKGFEPRGFGPKDTASKEYIGGNNSLYGVASVTLPSPVQEAWNLNTVAFLNAMNAWGTDNSNLNDSNKIRSAFGIAFDWKSPLGPLNISFAKPLTKEDTDKTKVFSFEIGTIF